MNQVKKYIWFFVSTLVVFSGLVVNAQVPKACVDASSALYNSDPCKVWRKNAGIGMGPSSRGRYQGSDESPPQPDRAPGSGGQVRAPARANPASAPAQTQAPAPTQQEQNNNELEEITVDVERELEEITVDVERELEEITVDVERKEIRVTAEMQSACDNAYRSAMVSCQGETITNAFLPQVKAFEFAKDAGNAKEACASAKKLTEIGAAATAAFTASCQFAQTKCVDSCTIPEGYTTGMYGENFSDKLEKCEKFSDNWKASLQQSVAYAADYMQSSQCEKMAGGDCNPGNQETYDNPACVDFYCMKPGRLSDPKCSHLASMCNDPNNRTQPVCICYTNPNHPSCPNGKPDPIPGPPALGGDPTKPNQSWFDKLFGDDEAPGFMGNGDDSLAGGSPVNAGEGGGGGGLGGGGSSGSAAAADDGGYGGSGTQTDSSILSGYGRGGTGGGYAGGYAAGGSAGAAGGGGARDFNSNAAKELNLRDFLPGGRKDGRSIANQKSLASHGISEAEGLSNWVKVSRKISQKRPSLMP